MGSNLIFVTVTLVYADEKRIGTTNQWSVTKQRKLIKSHEYGLLRCACFRYWDGLTKELASG